MYVKKRRYRLIIKLTSDTRNILPATGIYSVSFPLYRGRDDRRRDERKRRDPDRHGKSVSDSHRERERHERRRGSPRGRSYSRSRSRSGSRGKSRDRRGEKVARWDQLQECRGSCGRVTES